MRGDRTLCTAVVPVNHRLSHHVRDRRGLLRERDGALPADRRKGVIEAIRSTGGAVALCSMATIIGYGSLLLATNRALFLFRLVAVLGELACLVSAVVLLPAVLASWSRPQAHS